MITQGSDFTYIVIHPCESTFILVLKYHLRRIDRYIALCDFFLGPFWRLAAPIWQPFPGCRHGIFRQTFIVFFTFDIFISHPLSLWSRVQKVRGSLVDFLHLSERILTSEKKTFCSPVNICCFVSYLLECRDTVHWQRWAGPLIGCQCIRQVLRAAPAVGRYLLYLTLFRTGGGGSRSPPPKVFPICSLNGLR